MATISGNEGDLKTDMDNIRPVVRVASDDGPNDGHNAAGTAVEVADTGLETHGRVPHHEEANTPAEHSLVDQAVVEVKQGQDVDSLLQQMYAQIVYKDKNLLDLNNNILELERRLIDLQEHVGDKNEVIRGRDKVIEVLQLTIQEKENMISNQAKLVSKLSQNMESSDEKVSELQEQLVKANLELTSERERFNVRLSESQKYFEEILKEQEDKILNLKEKYKEKENELENVHAEFTELIRRQDRNIKEIMSVNPVNIEGSVIQALQQQIGDLHDVIAQKTSLIEALDSKCRLQESELENERKIQRSMKEKLQDLSEKTILSESNLMHVESELNIQRQNFKRKLEELLEKHEAEKTERHQQLSTLKSVCANYEQLYNQSMKEYSSLQDRHYKLSNQVLSFKSSASGSEIDASALIAENHGLSSDHEVVKTDGLKQLQDMCEDLSARLKAKEEELLHLQDTVDQQTPKKDEKNVAKLKEKMLLKTKTQLLSKGRSVKKEAKQVREDDEDCKARMKTDVPMEPELRTTGGFESLEDKTVTKMSGGDNSAAYDVVEMDLTKERVMELQRLNQSLDALCCRQVIDINVLKEENKQYKEEIRKLFSHLLDLRMSLCQILDKKDTEDQGDTKHVADVKHIPLGEGDKTFDPKEISEMMQQVSDDLNKYKNDNKKVQKISKGKDAKLKALNTNLEELRTERENLLKEKYLLENKVQDLTGNFITDYASSSNVDLEVKFAKLEYVLQQKDEEIQKLQFTIESTPKFTDRNTMHSNFDLLTKENEKLKTEIIRLTTIDKAKTAKIRQINENTDLVMNEKTEELSSKNTEVQELEKLFTSSKSQIHVLENETEKLKVEISKLQKINKGKESKEKQMEEMVAEKTNVLEQVNAENSRLKEKLIQLEHEVGDLNNDIMQLRKVKSHFEEELERSHKSLFDIKDKMESIQESENGVREKELSKVTSLEETVKILQEEKIILEYELDTAKEEVKNLKASHDDFLPEGDQFETIHKDYVEDLGHENSTADIVLSGEISVSDNEIKKKLANLSHKNKMLLQENTKVKMLVKGKDKKVKKLEELLKDQQVLISEKETDVLILQESVKDLNNKVKMLEDIEDDLKHKIDITADDLCEWKESCHDLEDQLDAAHDMLDRKTGEIYRLEDEIVACREDIEKVCIERDELERQRDLLKEDLDLFQNKISGEQDHLASLRMQMEKLVSVNEENKADIQNLNKIIQEKDSVIMESETQLKANELQLQESVTYIGQLSNEITLLKESLKLEQDQLASTRMQAQDVMTMNEHSKTEIFNLNKCIVVFEQKLNEVVIVNDQLNDEISALKECLNYKEDQLSSLQVQLQQSSEIYNNNQTELGKLNQMLEENAVTINEKDTMLEAIKLQLKENTVYNDEINNEMAILSDRYKSVCDELDCEKKSNVELRSKLNNLTKEIEKMTEEKGNYEKDMCMLNKHSESLQKVKEELESKLREKENEIVTLNSDLQKHVERLSKNEFENNNILASHQQIAEISQSWESRCYDLQTACTHWQQQCESYQNELQSVTDRLNLAENAAQMHTEEIVRLNKQVSASQAQVLEFNWKMTENEKAQETVYKAKLKNEMAMLNDRFKGVCDELDSEKNSNVQLRTDLSNITKEMNKLTEEKSNYDKHICILNKQSESCQQEIAELESKLREKETEIMRLNSDLQNHVETLSKNEIEYNNILASHQQIVEISRSWENRCNDLQTACCHWHQQCESYQNELQSVTDKLKIAESAAQMQTEDIVRLNENISASQALVLEVNSKLAENEKAQETALERIASLTTETKEKEMELVSLREKLMATEKHLEQFVSEQDSFKKAIVSLETTVTEQNQTNKRLHEDLCTRMAEVEQLNLHLVNTNLSVGNIQTESEEKMQSLENDIKLLNQKLMETVTECQQYKQTLLQLNVSVDALFQEKQTLEQKIVWYHNKYEEAQQEVSTKDHSLMQISEQHQSRQVLMSETENFIADLLNKTVLDDELETNKSNADDLALAQVFNENDADNNIVNEVDVSRRRIQGLLKSLESRFIKQASLVKSVQDNITSKQTLIQNENVLDEIGNNGSAIDTADGIIVETIQPLTSAVLETAGVTQGQTCMDSKTIKIAHFGHNIENVLQDHMEKEVSYEEEISLLQDKIKNLESKAESENELKFETEKLHQLIRSLEEELNTANVDAKDLEKVNISLKSTENELKNQIIQLKKQSQSLHVENDSLRKELKDTSFKKSEENLLLCRERDDNLQRTEQIYRELSVAQSTIMNLQATISQLTAEKQANDDYVKDKLTELDTFKSKLSEQEEVIESLKVELQQLHHLVEDFTAKDHNSQILIAELKEKCNIMKEEADKQNVNMTDLLLQLKDKDVTIASREEECLKMQEKLNTVIKDLENLTMSQNDMQKKFQDQEMESTSMKDVIDTEKEEVQSLYEQMNQLVSEKLDLEMTVEQCKRDLQRAAEEMRKFYQDRENMDEIQQMNENMVIENKALKQVNADFSKQIELNTLRINELESLLANSNSELSTLKTEFESSFAKQQELEHRVTVLTQNLEEERDQVQSVSGELYAKRESCNKLKVLLEEQNMMVHSLKETITSMSDDVDYSKKQSFNVQSELDQCKVKIGDLLNIIELLKAEKEQVCESNSKLEDIVSEKTRAIHTIFTEVVKMKSEFMKLKTSLQENIQSVNVLHTAVGYVGVAICVANTAERIEGHLVHSSDGVGTGDMADFALEVMKDEMENMSMKAIIDCMKQDLFEWSTQLSSGTQDNTQLYVKVCSLKEEIDKVRNENKLMEARISEMQSESEHAEKERSIHLMLENQTQTETNTDSGDTLKSKIEILEKENATLKQTVNEKEERFTKALATAKKIKFQLTKANESLQKEIALKAKLEKELQDEKEQSVSREQTLQEELNLSVEKICSLHEQLTQSHAIVKNLEKKVLKVESDADNQMKSLLEEHNTALDDVKKVFEEKKSDYNTHNINEEAIKKKEEQIQILSKEIDELRTCLSSFENKTSSMIEAVAGMVVKMTVLNAKLEIQNTHETFEATIDHADIGNLDSLKKDTSTQNKQFESKQIYELQTEFVRLKRMLEQVNMSYETQLDRSDKLQQENESLKCQLTMMQSESYTEPVVVDKVTVETVRPVTSALLESAIGAPVKTDSFADNQSQSVNNDNYQKTEVVYEKEISQCQEKVLNLESDISSTSNMKEVLQERITALENELSTERGGVHELNMFIISLQNEQQKLIDQVAHLEDQSQALKIENEGFKQELQELVSKKSEERLLFDTENQQSIKRVEELSRELSIAQNTIVTLKDSLKQITTEKQNHDNNERNMLTELDNCRSQLSEQEEKISHLQNDLQQTQYLVEEFTVKDQKSQTLIAELKEQYVMLQNDNASYQEVLEQMKSSNMDLQEVNSGQTIMLKSLQEEISKAGSVSETVEHLRNALNLVNEEKEKLEQDSLTNQAQHGEIQLLVTKLQDENKNLELQLVEMQRNMEMQESQKKILEEQSNGLNSNFEAVQNECKLLEAQTVELRRNVDMLQNEHTIMEEKCASLNNKFEAIQKENGMLEAHNVELNAVVETYQNQKKMLDVQFEDLKGTVEGIQNEKEMLEVQLEELSKTVEIFQNDKRLSEVESSNLKMNSETIQNINTVLEATNAELSRKVETLENEKKMLASQIMELNCMVESMQHEKEKVELQIDDLKRVVETIQPENKMLKDKLNELQTLQHKFTILEEQSVELYNTLEILQNEKKMLESQILELSGTYETLHNEKALLEAQFDQLTKMMKELQNQNEILRTQSSELNTTVETLQSMLDSQSVKLNKKLEILENGNRLLEAQTVELGSTIETLQHEKTVLEAKTEDLEISMEMVQNDKSLFEAHSSELNSNINTLQSRNTTLEAKLLDLCTNLETLKTEKKILEEQSSDLLRNVETLQNKDNMLQTQNRELNIQINSLKNDNKVLEDQILNLNATITSTQAQLKLSENDKEEQVKIIKELGANLDDANISIHDLNTEVKCLKEIISSVTEYVKSFNESDLKQAVDHHGFSETGNMSLKESTVKSIKELQENITSMGNVVKNTHDENVTLKKAMAKAKSQLSKFDALRSEYESLSDEYTKVIADNSSLTTQVKELYLKFNKLNEYDSQKATTTELQHLEKTNKTLLERISQLENECSTLHSQYVKLLQSKSTVETSMQQTSLENNALKMQLETKGDKSGQLHGEYSKLHRQFEVTVQEKSRLKLEHDMMERRLQQMEARCQQLALQVSQLAEDRSFLNSQLGSLSKTLRGREKEITVVQQQYRDLYNTHTSLQRKISQLEKNLFVECIDKVTPQSSGPVTPVGYSPSPTPDLKRPESVPRFVKGDHPHLEQTLEISLHERLGEEQIMKSDESGKMQDIELTRDASGSYLRRLQRWMALQREKTHTE